ncbi:MAG: hypothetical protein JSR33_00380 [Proteobacteria bacterium]|nr:hypothetical protein [Pseudomonadota bacterium]
MSKKKSLTSPQEEEFIDNLYDEAFGEEEESIINTFSQVAEASVEHMKVACRLTRLIVETNKSEKLSTDQILEIFRKCSDTILDCTPLKALFDKQ